MTTTTVMSAKEPERPHEGSNPPEDAATVRRTFIWLALAAALLLLPPRQWVSSGIMGVVTLLLFVWHIRKQNVAAKQAEAAKVAAAKTPVTEAPVADEGAETDEEQDATDGERDDEEDEEDDREEEQAVADATLSESGEKDRPDGAG